MNNSFPDIPSCGIIGAGKVGLTLAEALFKHGMLKWVVARSEDAKNRIKVVCKDGIKIYSQVNDIENFPDLTILAVNDSEIEKCSNELAGLFGHQMIGKTIMHCSGILSLSVLSLCAKLGAKAVAAHPYQTFYHPSSEILKGIAWGIDAGEAYPIISKFIKALDGKPIDLSEIPEFDRALYHCSAVVSSNFMNIIISASKEIANKAGVSPEAIIPPIVKTTLGNNLHSLSVEKEMPMTGPFARGDIDTIRLHLESMKNEPELLKIYCYLSHAANASSFKFQFIQENIYYEIKTLINCYLKDS